MATERARFEDGNVGAEVSPSRGYGDLRLWVETRDGYKHSLYVTKDELDRLIDCADKLMVEVDLR